ncbi:hypothetical protein I215_02458 [Galbibacter marinus]|uniref:DUF2752 domain-containing protein n=1 Tax=Galbibacter marinus TaxID=555500 RepID=K2P5U7_9FLAO|nr:DUF2752 domain-containing protein [Galbibacter marinus]EKF56348.1 hypothetical protein I215_02458 [Galbibacter marinus]
MIQLLSSSVEDLMLPCLNKTLFGMECPGCGLQRSLLLIGQGEFVAAFKMYPAIYPLLGFIIFIGLSTFMSFKNSNKIKMYLAVLTIATIIISFIIKLI